MTERSSDVIEMHLFDEEEAEEKALCEANTSADHRRSVSFYLADRLYGVWVGAICEACKARAIPFAANLASNMEAEGQPDEAEAYRRFAGTLARETGQNPPGG